MDSFGPFESRDITGLSPGLNVIIGPDQEYLNAFRDFFRRVLFGFDVNATNHSGSLSAPCGGLLEIVHSDGSPLTIERYLRGLGGDAGQGTVSRAGELRPELDDLFGPALLDVDSWLNCFDISPGTIDHDADELLKLTFSLLAGTDGPDPGEVQAFFDNEAASIARAMTAVQTARHVAYERYRRSGEDVEIGSFVAAEPFPHPMFLDRPFRRSRSRARRSLSVGLGCRRGCQTSNGSEHNHASDSHPPHPTAERLGHVRGDPRGSSTPRRPLDAWRRRGPSPPPTFRAAPSGISP